MHDFVEMLHLLHHSATEILLTEGDHNFLPSLRLLHAKAHLLSVTELLDLVWRSGNQGELLLISAQRSLKIFPLCCSDLGPLLLSLHGGCLLLPLQIACCLSLTHGHHRGCKVSWTGMHDLHELVIHGIAID